MNWWKFKIRLKIIYGILFKKHTNWAFISIKHTDLSALLEDKAYGIYIMTHGLHEYAFYKLVKIVAKEKDDIDMLLDKAKFEAEAQLNADEESRSN